MNHKPLAFQRRFIDEATKPDIDIAALSSPRAQGKSWIAGRLIASSLTPRTNYLWMALKIVWSVAVSTKHGFAFRFARQLLGEGSSYRYQDSAQRIAITHTKSGTRLRVLSSDPKRALGIVGARIVIGDEPGSWNTLAGESMYDALLTSIGKNKMSLILMGTIAPALAESWWPRLIADGSTDGVHVTLLQGDPESWDDWRTIVKCNPLVRVNTLLASTLKRELKEALRDSRLQARFKSYRLNLPTSDTSTVLVTTKEWDKVLGRQVPTPEGRPTVGLDCGSERSWSSAVAIYPNGYVTALALGPGIPDLTKQEQRDLVPNGTYTALASNGSLIVSEGKQVPDVAELIERILVWRPTLITCDRFKIATVLDAVKNRCRVEPRVTRWSSASEDIRALRKILP